MRTINAFRNFITGFAGQLVSMLLSFASRTVFIYVLGEEYLGVNGLFSSILSVLSFSELGIGAAITYELYKPIADKDSEKIRSLMLFYKKAYFFIGSFILLAGLVLLPFLPYLMKETTGLVNVRVIYVLFLVNNAASYWLFSYKQNLLYCMQKNYVNALVTAGTSIAATVLQIVLLLALRKDPVTAFYAYTVSGLLLGIASNYALKYQADKSIIKFGTYVSMFPQLIAGPIVNYDEVKPELDHREVKADDIERGATLFVLGLAYKVLLANKIASLWNDVQTVGPYGINTVTAWLGSWGYSFQLLFDFMGYSVMAIGIGLILGFRIPENFVDPYMAHSLTDFWRRWHVTLGRWFREYVYIPMGGNRKGKLRMILAMFTVWMFTGLWHGADWNFLIWGLFLFVFLLMEKLFLGKVFDKVKVLGHVYMFFLIPISWTIFNISDLKLLGLYLKRMFGMNIEGSVTTHAMDKLIMLGHTYWWLLLICVIFCTPWPRKLIEKFYKNWVCKLVMLALFWFCVYQIAKGGSNPFLYFRF